MFKSGQLSLASLRGVWVILAVLALYPVAGWSQGNPFDGEDAQKEEAAVEQFERKKVERPDISEEEGKGPKLERESNIKGWERSKLQYQDKAIRLMEERVEKADEDDPDYPLYLERLSEMYWQKARFHDLRAFDRLTESREAEDAGNASKAAELVRGQEEDEKTAQEYREKTIATYARIIKEFPLYDNSDKVLFYLAFNLGEMGRAEDANGFYKDLVRDYPNTDYLAEAYLGLAEYSYLYDDIDLSLSQYESAIAAAPDSQTAGYAMYKMGWCYFNRGEPKKALAQFESVVAYSESHTGRIELRKEAVKDLVKAYSLWTEASPKKAKGYLGKFSSGDEELREMLERLARLYQEDGEVDKSIFVYNELIKDNSTNFRIVGYQTEIMLNVETKNVPDQTAEEVIRTVRLFNAAREQKLEGATEEAVKEAYALLEEYTRETAKWYHLTAQTTKNPLYYALSYEIYKAYVDNFPEAQDNYEMMYYYGELLYWKKNYAEAAKRYDQVLAIDAAGKFSRDAAYGAVLSYNKVSETPTAECPPIPVVPEPKKGEEPTFPELTIADCRVKLIAACGRYAEVVPDGEHIVDIKYTAARIYYDHNQFGPAVKAFEDIAMNHSENRLGIISANLLLDSLGIEKDYKQMWEWVLKFRANEQLNRPPLDDILETLETELAFKFCIDKETEKLWKESAMCFEEYAGKYATASYAPKALWNASVDWENASEVGKAIETRIRLLKEHGDDDYLAPKALYAIGQNFHGIAVYSEAARFYEMFVDKYPKNDTACAPDGESSENVCSMSALQNAAAFRGGLGQYEKAVEDYDRYIVMFPNDKAQISLLKFNTGRIYFDQGLYEKAIERYNEYLSRYAKLGPEGRKVAAMTAIGRCYWKNKDRHAGLKSFEKAEKLYDSKPFQKWLAGADPEAVKEANDAAAEARFMRGEGIFFEALAIRLSDETIESATKSGNFLKRQLTKKAALMQEAKPIYVEVITRFNNPKWGLAAMCRLGMMYHDVADQIQNAPIPKELDEDQSLIYEDLLLEFADRFETEAIGYYITAVEKAADLGWFSTYTTLAQRRLFDLRPEEYRSASEIKAQPDRASVTWHKSKLYVDVEAAAGRKAKKKRGAIDLQSNEMEKVKGEGDVDPEGVKAPE
ncbi:MAG: hypothetical protein AUK47_15405 [Deltaproteobacteria bacterium CG2_30_63_29]|nr:MAG: hypothetical protein AUK47_15405 [Deltaproteobacteria bacterium CG2_30_63_29]